MNEIKLGKPDYFPVCRGEEQVVLSHYEFKIWNHLPSLTPGSQASIRRIRTLDRMLQEATDHSCRDKVVAILQTLLVVACATIIVAFTIIFFAPDILIMYTALYILGALYISLEALQSMKNIEDLGNNQNPSPLTIEAQTFLQAPVLAPILPLYEAFTRKSRLERARDALAPIVEKELGAIRNHIYQQVYQKHPESPLEILTELKKVREKLQESQQEFQNFEVEHNPGYWDSPHKIGGYQKEEIAAALTYVNRLIDFLESPPE